MTIVKKKERQRLEQHPIAMKRNIEAVITA